MKYRVAILLFAGIFCCLTNCSDQTPVNKPIKIGLLIDVNSASGPEAIQAAKLYFKTHFNNNHVLIKDKLHPIELVLEDSKQIPNEAMLAARRLIYQHKVVAIIGTNISITALPAAEVAQQAKVPLISPATTLSAISQNRDFVYQLAFNDVEQGRFLAEFLYQRLKTDSAAVIYSATTPASQAVAKSFINQFSSQGGNILLQETFVFDPDECASIIEQSIDSSTKAVLLPVPYSLSKRLLEQIRLTGFDGNILGNDSWHPPDIEKENLFEGAYFSHHWHASLADSDQQNKNFVQDFHAEFQQSPNSMAALTFDAIALVIEALRKGNTKPAQIQQYLSSLQAYSGLTGTINLTNRNQLSRIPIMLRVNERKASVVE